MFIYSELEIHNLSHPWWGGRGSLVKDPGELLIRFSLELWASPWMTIELLHPTFPTSSLGFNCKLFSSKSPFSFVTLFPMAHSSTFHFLPASLRQGRDQSPESLHYLLSAPNCWGSHCLPLSCCLFLSSFGHIHTCIPQECVKLFMPQTEFSLFPVKSFLPPVPISMNGVTVYPVILSGNTLQLSLSLKILFAIHHYILRILYFSLQPQFS